MKRTFLLATVVAVLSLSTASANAAALGVTANAVNLRAGPGTQHVVVVVVPPGQSIVVAGCLANSAWCDVSWASYRGWMNANYIHAQVGGQTVVVTDVHRRVPVVAPWVDARRDARVQYRVNRRWDRWLGQ